MNLDLPKSTQRFRIAVIALIAAGGLVGCSPSDTNKSAGSTKSAETSLSFVGFAVPQAADEALQHQFASTKAGKGASFQNSFGASGDQSRAVEAGKSADIVHFSLEGDVTRLVKAGLVDSSWNSGPHHGIISTSVVVLVVRKGNPKNIKGWDDIVKPGIGIVTPNPGSSGSARWNILAAWAHATSNGGSDETGKAFISKFFDNVVTLSGSGREATTAFQAGTGDVLISYENEAIFARQSGAELDYVIPDETLLIENPAAALKGADPLAGEFLKFATTTAGQKTFGSKGFRPLDGVEVGSVEGATDPASPYPAPSGKLFTVADFGGWSAVNAKFFATKEKEGEDGVITTLQKQSGKGNS